MVKRVNYFDNQFLTADDFNDEQAFHIAMRRMHNSMLHTSGIAKGLSLRTDQTRLVVAQGFAVDRAGKELPLDNDWDTDFSKPGTPRGPQYVLIQWNEDDSDKSSDASAPGVIRKLLRPIISYSTDKPKDGDTDKVVL